MMSKSNIIILGREHIVRQPRQSLGLEHTINSVYYGFMKSNKIDWSLWQFTRSITSDILFQHNALRYKYRGHLDQIVHTTEIHHTAISLIQWLRHISYAERARWTLIKYFDAIAAVWLWIAETLVWEFQQEMLITLQQDAFLDFDQSVECPYIANSIQFCKQGMEEELGMRLEFGTDKGKNAEERLLHL